MKFADFGKYDEVFTFIDNRDDSSFMLNSSALVEHLRSNNVDPFIIPVDYEHAEHVMNKNGVNFLHVARVSNLRLLDPILLLCHEDGTHILADGNHRYVRAWQLRRLEISAYMPLPEVWRPFVAEDVPPDILEIARKDVKKSVR